METDFGSIGAKTQTIPERRSRGGLLGIALLFCCSLLFSGCMVEFTKPLAGSRHVTVDRNLLGRWSGVDEKGNPGFIQFDKAGAKEMVVSVFGKDSNLGYSNPVFRLSTTKIGAVQYLILKAGRPDANSIQTIAKYSIDGNKLRIWVLSVDKVKEAIKNGQLHGTVRSGLEDSVVVSSARAEVVRFIQHGQDDLFSLFGEYQKLTTRQRSTMVWFPRAPFDRANPVKQVYGGKEACASIRGCLTHC
jgi:hypothetical protein